MPKNWQTCAAIATAAVSRASSLLTEPSVTQPRSAITMLLDQLRHKLTLNSPFCQLSLSFRIWRIS